MIIKETLIGALLINILVLRTGRAPTWCTVLMSALQVNHSAPDRDGMRLFKWKQPVPTPAYLSKSSTSL
jgi:hypothetical protein